MSAESEGWSRRPDLEERVREGMGEVVGDKLSVHAKGDVMVILNRHPFGKPVRNVEPDVRWHISVSHPERIPTWEEVADACHSCRPGIPFVMGVPPKSWWMTVHPNVLHLWETRDTNLIEDWRLNAMGHEPTGGAAVGNAARGPRHE